MTDPAVRLPPVAANLRAALRLLVEERGDAADRIEAGVRTILLGPDRDAARAALAELCDDGDPALRRHARRLLNDAELESFRREAGRAGDPAGPDRLRMVRDQIVAQGLDDPRVVRALLDTPREAFVPAAWRAAAYDDRPLPLADGQTVSQPYVVAFMTQALGLRGTERVLEIGTGSGYQAAILARVAREVFSIEIREALSRQAAETLAALGVGNVRLRVGDGHAGWPEAAPFDAVLLTCAPPTIPPLLLDQLREGGGRLVAPVGDDPDRQSLVRLTRSPRASAKNGCWPSGSCR